MPQLNDLSRSLVALDQDTTIIAVVELSQSSWLVAEVLPGSAWLLCTLARQSQSTCGSTLSPKAARDRHIEIAAPGDLPTVVEGS